MLLTLPPWMFSSSPFPGASLHRDLMRMTSSSSAAALEAMSPPSRLLSLALKPPASRSAGLSVVLVSMLVASPPRSFPRFSDLFLRFFFLLRLFLFVVFVEVFDFLSIWCLSGVFSFLVCFVNCPNVIAGLLKISVFSSIWLDF